MQRIVRAIAVVLFLALLLAALAVLLSPDARALAPTWLTYDLVGRRYSPLPAAAEQWVLGQGQDFCSVGRDSECGGYRVVRAQSLAINSAASSQGTAAAWCVDYAILRRNTGRLTGPFIYWSSVPRAMIVMQQSDGQFQGYPVERCDMTTLNP